MSDNYNHYNHITPDTLKSTILIEIRNIHTSKIAKELVNTGIIPREYLDNLLRIDMMKQSKAVPDIGFNDSQRIEKLIQLLQKHSIARTASFISNLY
jgi:hypothetical protein